MAGRPSAEEVRKKQKEAKQKKLILILVPVLVIAVAFQLPRVLGGSDDADTSAADEAAQTTDGTLASDGAAPAQPVPATAPAPADPASGEPVPVEGAPPVELLEPVDLSDVPDSDPTFAAGEGQLVAFSRFVGGDPFVQLVDVPAESEETAAQESASGGGGGEPQAPSSGDGVAEGAPALIEINGELESVEVDGTFPADDPAFRLVATTEDAVEFGLVEGSFSSGIDTLDLEVGKSITLVSQPDGFRFTIKLIGFPAEFQGPEPAVTATEQP